MTRFDSGLIDHRRWSWLVLFASSTTLVCCALPILFVTLGLGAVSAGLFSALPFLVTLAQHKLFIFIGSGILLAIGAWAVFRPNRSCPVDPALAALCQQADKFNKRVLLLSMIIWTIGFAAAYLALPVWYLFNS